MKILLVGDLHMCKQSSIITSNGTKYSKRLENCINTINWVEQTALENSCDEIVYLGDFFDTPELNDETLTAIKDIKWSPINKYIIVGNHESSVNGLRYNATKVLEANNIKIVDSPETVHLSSVDILMLPYIVEQDRKPLAEYWQNKSSEVKKLLFMHNDIAGIQMGPIVSKTGFTKEDILNNSDLCIDGHLHNGTWIEKDRIRTLGNITGQNFGEDASRYSHNIMILDTDTLQYKDIENPYAFNFYKLEINSEKDIEDLKKLKNNAVLSVKCNEKYIDRAKIAIESLKVAESRIIITQDTISGEPIAKAEDLSVDHIEKFIQFCKEKIDNTKLLDEELAEICK